MWWWWHARSKAVSGAPLRGGAAMSVLVGVFLLLVVLVASGAVHVRACQFQYKRRVAPHVTLS